MSDLGRKLLKSLAEAAAGDYRRVYIAGQTWVRDDAVRDYELIPKERYDALLALRPIVARVAHARAPLNDSVYREARAALDALKATDKEKDPP